MKTPEEKAKRRAEAKSKIQDVGQTVIGGAIGGVKSGLAQWLDPSQESDRLKAEKQARREREAADKARAQADQARAQALAIAQNTENQSGKTGIIFGVLGALALVLGLRKASA